MSSNHSSVGNRIVIDWGTTTFRAVLVGSDGRVRDSIETARGISILPAGAHEAELMTHIGPWLTVHGPMPIYALGMITSRNGWVEVPYVACPASLEDLAAGTIRRHLSNGSRITFLAGINDPARRPFADVMRGEETQIVGCSLDQEATVVLPGTHSKWARIASGRIAGFQTFVTGELFALFSVHSFIAKAAPASGSENMEAFDRGVTEALEGSAEAESLPTLIFSCRTGMLANKLAPAEIRDYVSGLLIGHEFARAHTCGWAKPGDEILVVGNDGLNARYSRAARLAGLEVRDGGEDAGLHGALAIAELLERQENAV